MKESESIGSSREYEEYMNDILKSQKEEEKEDKNQDSGFNIEEETNKRKDYTSMMQEKGIEMFQMMKMMCPKCLSVATSKVSEDDKTLLKSQMSEVFANI